MNTIQVTSGQIAKQAMRAFYNALSLGSGINMEYKSEFAQGGATGKNITVNVKKPPRFTVSTGQALDLQDVLEESVPLTIQYQDHVDFQFSSADLALGIVNFTENYIKPAGEALAAKFNARVAALYKKCNNFVGTPGTVPSTSITYSHARTALNLAGCPDEGKRRMVVTSNMHAYAVDALKGLLNPIPEISDQYRRGVIGKALGFTWQEDNSLLAHTVGVNAGAPLVNGANQTGSSVVCDAWTATGTVKQGDSVQFAGVYGVNPLTYESTGVLQNFVITADTTADGAGNITLPIWPAIVLTGSTQNVTNAPADNAAVTVFSHATSYSGKVSPTGMAFHPKAITAAFVDLPLPRGADMASRISDSELGISMRVWRDGDIKTDQFPCRVDIFYGLEVLRPEWVCRIQG